MFRSEEDYLKQIYELSVERGKELITIAELAENFGYSDQSVNEKVKKLVGKEYVIFKRYKGISLTEKGLNEALRMVRAHRLWEVFLQKELQFSWTHLHDDAEELEHSSSDKVIQSLYHYLGEPKYCTHGNPIPDLSGESAPIADKRLYDCRTGDIFILKRVLDHKELLDLLKELDIKIESKLVLKEKNDFAGQIYVEHNSKIKQLSPQIAKMLFTFS
ncbi:metal-dependent transcriptional regulator [Bavariicoccus seileri]|uniref:metal-dependent transcriptional regulator n=1 Tax=Bavariicoccus seileri TaxID=549685 RepID=UPI0003B35B2F|nr:metal-dependent transcriptional regulator [Bavariicoccus seileri]